ncbi:MAG TPA: 2-C-methyl-D-erythritol 4-phosphate cytidylyltransferase [Chthoniobacterales bacterium]|nr:2-C-methyl-D-erythritol 4-phosphate cytidylyltransferase [Chthoniobacterales bacterium]
MLSVIIVAAGSSERMGFDKVFAPIAGRPMISYTIDAFERAACVDDIILVGRSDSLPEFRKLLPPKTKVSNIVPGGAERSDSVRAGLSQLVPQARFVAVHDAARPMIAPEKIELVFEACRAHGAAALAEPITDTLKRGEFNSEGANPHLVVTGSVDRKQLYAMQTPQIFKRDVLDQAYEKALEKRLSVTDEVSAVELLGHEVVIVPNHDFNFKITYPRDFLLAEFVLRQRAANK